ncbi:MAG: tripartite tricarboxylate transporter substrate binding protein [Betaproteobacteria bacterium]|nr:MAG: tripartite tricarboxylate transporter substrate binding protein [Betaproteobacteria bacterium]
MTNQQGGVMGARRRFAVALTGVSLLLVGLPAQAQGWQPDRNVEIVINTAPGSGQDATGRLIQKILQERKAVPTSLTVVNKPGGGGAIAYGYLNQHPGDGHFVSIASKSLLTNHISGRATVTYTHLTPLAILFEEYITVAVKADSPIRSGRELLDRLKKDPGAVSFGVATSLGNPNHQGVAMAMKDAGIDLRKTKTAVFQSGGNAITALLGGHVDVVPGSVGLMRKHLQAGSVRLIAVASPQRLAGVFAQVPTWKEQGANAIVSNWRGMIGPGGMTPAQTAYWDNALKQLTQSEAWKKELETNNWADEYKSSAETRKYMDGEYAELKGFLTELELAKTK